jgi:hypothetical protein
LNKLTNQQLKDLIASHEVKWNLTILIQKAQQLINLATQIQESIATLENELEINQSQLLTNLEQLRIIKHHLPVSKR